MRIQLVRAWTQGRHTNFWKSCIIQFCEKNIILTTTTFISNFDIIVILKISNKLYNVDLRNLGKQQTFSIDHSHNTAGIFNFRTCWHDEGIEIYTMSLQMVPCTLHFFCSFTTSQSAPRVHDFTSCKGQC